MSDLQFPGLYIGEAADLRPALPSLVRCGYYALVMAADVSNPGRNTAGSTTITTAGH